eukprot:Plantae.Rhodophyta-Purpureofilum_apyrenoidigerum.ctg5705.p1 GENE.Plantae.Rhodophyta-Purpureofilum_apyrenoidigerum.ctg5705~~Plantae.Rhodophyta-Purpureofilum_apyrenoidigerum.ctg5705.p1  ORF type:complete len:341 (-),score=82.07 Plantae.Rhodophyta-Purpureofilum_apyrenoidigerum.ctg5705:705-1727(-)
MADESSLAKSYKIFSAVALYWVISISMVFVNKTLLSDERAKIDAPLFITWYQCIVTVLVVWVLGALNLFSVPKFEIKKDLLPKMLPLSCVFTGMILFNNLCLKYVEVSFYQVARSLTIFFNVIFDWVVLGNVTSPKALGCVFLVFFGFVLGNVEEVRWSFWGTFFGVTASFLVAMNAIYVKKKYPLVDNDPWKITLYNNVISSVLFIPLMIAFGEPMVVARSPKIYMSTFWFLMTIGGALGVLISFATAAQIKYTSPLTHNISATAKAAAQTVIALQYYRNPTTFNGKLSIAIVLLGSLLYTLVRRQEMQARDKAKAEAENVTTTVNESKTPMTASEDKK